MKAGGGLSLGGAVFLIFLVLKLLAVQPVAAWSWWWVTSPIWISWGVVIGFLLGVAIVASVAKDYK